jgi:outer membrane protein assembly factor BamB
MSAMAHRLVLNSLRIMIPAVTARVVITAAPDTFTESRVLRSQRGTRRVGPKFRPLAVAGESRAFFLDRGNTLYALNISTGEHVGSVTFNVSENFQSYVFARGGDDMGYFRSSAGTVMAVNLTAMQVRGPDG